MRWVALVALAAMLAVAGVARAQTLEQQREWCEDVSDPDHAIDGYMAVIEAQGTGSLGGEVGRLQQSGLRLLKEGRTRPCDRRFPDQAIRLDPEIALAFINRGDAYAAIGQYSRAIGDLDQAIRIDPSSPTAFNDRCWTRALSGARCPRPWPTVTSR